MSTWGLALAAALYVLTAADFYLKDQPWLALAFLGYAFSNVAFIGATQQ